MKVALFAQLWVLALIASGVSIAVPQGNSNTHVLVGFDGDVNFELISHYGGRVENVYNNFPIVLATLPERSVDALSHNSQVRYVEETGTGELLDQTLPWGVDRIDAEKVWEDPNKGTNIEIAILDSGMDYGHEDLDANYVLGYDFYNNDDDPMDDNGHGTHVAGILAAEENDIGIVGVAPEADLYIGKVS
ncbi:MAG: S8 family serine peptidase, partial [Thermoplasmata archaeon]